MGKKRLRPLTAKRRAKLQNKQLRPNIKKRLRAGPKPAKLKAPILRGVKPGTKRGKYKARVSKVALRAAGLPIPASLDLGVTGHGAKRAFAKLQAKWYEKLKADGLEDIEWHDEQTGHGQNSSYLKRPDQMRIKHARPASYEFYRLCTCYLQHNTDWKQKGDKLIWQHYTEGTTYRKILKLLERLVSRRRSLFYVHGRIHAMREHMYAWQRTSEHGLLNGCDDLHVDDILLREPSPVPKAD